VPIKRIKIPKYCVETRLSPSANIPIITAVIGSKTAKREACVTQILLIDSKNSKIGIAVAIKAIKMTFIQGASKEG